MTTTSDAPPPEQPFHGLGLDPRLVGALASLGYEEPTPIQREAIPALLAGRDLLGQAATGTGKTAAFALPILERLAAAPERRAMPGRAPMALVLVPTRELAMQVAEAIARYGAGVGVRVTAIYGGEPIHRQLGALRAGLDVVVATPGRALDHLQRKTLDLGGVRVAVLDEGDEMLDMGFAEDMEKILGALPADRQTALFSATLPAAIVAIARRHLRDPLHIQIAHTVKGAVPKVQQIAYLVERPNKLAALARVLDVERPQSALVFCRTRVDVDELTQTLGARGHKAEALHGGLSQDQRDRVMARFRAGSAALLVATDVAARGLDIKHLSHVINFEAPSAPEDYVHRIGRTGRAGREGIALLFVEPRELRLVRNIERLTKQKIAFRPIPSVADLRGKQLELLRSAVDAAVAAGGLERFAELADALVAGGLPARDVMAAALELVHEASGWARTEEEIPVPAPPRAPRPVRPAFGGGLGGRPQGRVVPAGRGPAGKGAKGAGKAPRWKVTRLFVGAGREANIRPADLVGLIANEAGLEARAIGAIEIHERFATVEVPEEVIGDLVAELGHAKLKGKKVIIRRDRG